MVEYKFIVGNLTRAEREVLGHLANDRPSPLPLVLAHYSQDPWCFRAEPLNEAARRHFDPRGERLTEREWASRWYEIRGEKPKPEMLAALDNAISTRI